MTRWLGVAAFSIVLFAVACGHRSSHTSSASASFHASVQPVLERACSSCHMPGEAGAAHWQLATAGDAAADASGIDTVTAPGYMPPWPASSRGSALSHPLTLSTSELRAIHDWASSGGKLDVPASTPLKPSKEAADQLPRRDLVLTRPDYLGSLDRPNDYRCFALDPKLDHPMYLTGYSFLSDQVAEIHHALVFHVTATQRARVPAVDGADGKPGWQCYGGPGLGGGGAAGESRVSALTGDVVAAWVPGQQPAVFPEHSGILMQPGDALVLQVHYHFDGKVTPDRSGLALQLDPESSGVRPMRIVNPLAPVEIPCPAGATAPLCDRAASLADYGRQYGLLGQFAEPVLLASCGQSADQLQRAFDGHIARSSCTVRVPESGSIVTVFGHMHTLGKSFDMTLDPGGPHEQLLLDIPNWQFDWQMSYSLAKPVRVSAGDRIRIDCVWDRDRAPNRAPRYIVFAEGTEDEMCFGAYGLVTGST